MDSSVQLTEEQQKQVDQDFNEALAKIRTGSRRRTKNFAFIDEAESFSKQFRQRMMEAAEQDIKTHEAKQPALEKFKLLPKVTEIMLRKDLEEHLLDNGILEAIRVWLEPFDDAVLPSVDLQISLLDSLAKMKIETDHLKESGIGRIIMFMYNCPRFIPEVKRKAGDLIAKWCKPILRTSSAAAKNVNSDEEQQRPAKRLVVKNGEKDLEIDMERVHASIPQPALFDYPVRPKSKIDVAEIKEASKDKNARFQEFAGKIGKKTKSIHLAKLIKPSVEGKGLI